MRYILRPVASDFEQYIAMREVAESLRVGTGELSRIISGDRFDSTYIFDGKSYIKHFNKNDIEKIAITVQKYILTEQESMSDQIPVKEIAAQCGVKTSKISGIMQKCKIRSKMVKVRNRDGNEFKKYDKYCVVSRQDAERIKAMIEQERNGGPIKYDAAPPIKKKPPIEEKPLSYYFERPLISMDFRTGERTGPGMRAIWNDFPDDSGR